MATVFTRTLVVSIAIVLTAPAAEAQVQLVDLDGRSVDALQTSPGIRANAFIFTTTDCPIANRYAPELRRLHEEFSSKGIRFWLVYANPRERVDAIRDHAKAFDYPMRVLRDPKHDLVKHLSVTVTPETAIVDRSGRIVYRGRIDDRQVDFGVERPAATKREFRDALSAVTDGTPVAVSSTRAVGCIIADFQPVTFTKDIAPLIFDKCASCHRPTGAAPFSLLTYRDVRQRASQIAAVTASRYMPPYRARSSVGEFVGQKVLSDADVALIRRWTDEGAVEGNAADLPMTPTFAEGWQLGAPDLVVTTAEPFVLKPEAADVFRIFVIRLPIDAVKYVTGLEFQPGNARVVHHANIRLDHTPASRRLDEQDPAPGYDGLMARSAVYPEGHFLGWTPGQIAPLVPHDMAWRLDPGTDLVVQLHMQPSGAREIVQPTIGLFFGKEAPTRTPTILRLGSQGIDIQSGERRYVVNDSYLLPADVELQALQPHAHYRLREVRGTATFPDGSERSLIQIDEWDFRWQHVYRLANPVALPKGTRLSMSYTYDNSAENPRIPQQPLQRVFWGQRSVDEMGDLWFQFVAKNDQDRARLYSEIQQKMTTEDVIGYETMLRANPADAELHDDVAMLYLSLGRASEAVDHFSKSTALKPREAAAHFNLATALSVAGRLNEAIAEYRVALELRPDYASAHNNLGIVLATNGRVAEAIPHFRDATRTDPANVQAHRNLAWYLATSPDVDTRAAREAVVAGERAVQLTSGREPVMLDALAAAYAAAREFDRAVTAAERAMALTSDESLMTDIRRRVELYRRGQRLREP